MIYVAIDPGKCGAIVSYDSNSNKYYIYDIPTVKITVKKSKKKSKTETQYDIVGLRDIFNKIFLQTALAGYSPNEVFVVCELSMGMAFVATNIRGSYFDNPKTAFEKGRGYGIIESTVSAFGMSINTVRPSDWKRAMGLTNSELTYKQKKDASIELAKKLHPELKDKLKRKKDDGRAEAILLIDWAIKKYQLE